MTNTIFLTNRFVNNLIRKLIAGVTVSLAIACAACHAPRGPAAVGSVAPDLGVTALNGDSVRLAQLRDSVVLLNVWATWCVPCRREMPELQGLHQQYRARRLKVVGLSVDEAGSRADVAAFVKDFALTYTIWLDPTQQVSPRFGLVGVPATFLIDRGVIRWKHFGPIKAGNPDFTAALARALAPNQSRGR